MAYADQEMSSSKLVSIVIVILVHAFLGYALVTGLAYSAVKKVAQDLNVIEVKEEEPPPPEEELPPPPDTIVPETPPPVVSPPPIVRTPAPAPQIRSVDTPPPVIYQAPIAAPPAPTVLPPPPPPPPPVAKRPNPVPRGRPGDWANSNDYPVRALNENRGGVARFRVTVGTNGRVTECSITTSSGHADLDKATCDNIRRRARFEPALDNAGNPTSGTWSNAVRWDPQEAQ